MPFSKLQDRPEDDECTENTNLSTLSMKELENKIQEARNQRQRLLNEIAEQVTSLNIKEAERRMIDSFIDTLNYLKKSMEK